MFVNKESGIVVMSIFVFTSFSLHNTQSCSLLEGHFHMISIDGPPICI